MDQPFRQVGVTYGGEGVSGEHVDEVRLKLSSAANLQDLAKEYMFYSPALMYIGVRLAGRDPHNDFLAECSSVDVGRISIQFSKPIFRGMELGNRPDWNYVLYGMPVKHWPAFLTFQGSLAFHDRDQQLLTRLRTQEIEIADPLYFEKAVILPEECPTVLITVFALDTNKGCMYVKTGDHPLLSLPEVVRTSQSFQDTVLFASELAEERRTPNPYARIDHARGVDADYLEREVQERARKIRENNDESGTDSAAGRI